MRESDQKRKSETIYWHEVKYAPQRSWEKCITCNPVSDLCASYCRQSNALHRAPVPIHFTLLHFTLPRTTKCKKWLIDLYLDLGFGYKGRRAMRCRVNKELYTSSPWNSIGSALSLERLSIPRYPDSDSNRAKMTAAATATIIAIIW